MKGRLSHLFIVGGSLTFLASLYLPWAVNHTPPCPPSSTALVCAFSQQRFVQTGWFSEFGAAAGIVALALIASEVLKFVGRSRILRVPVPTAAFALLFLSGMTALTAWNSAVVQHAFGRGRPQSELGMYLGLASGAVVFIAAAGPRALRFSPRFSLAPIVGIALGLGLLAAVVVPQATFHVPASLMNGSVFPTWALELWGGTLQVAVCVLACFSLRLWGTAANARPRLALTAAIALLTAAFLAPIAGRYAHWPWELWLLLACAAGLLVLALLTARGVGLARPAVADAATVAAAIVLLVSLFLPWQGSCAPSTCSSTATGWAVTVHAGLFTVLMLLGLLGYRRSFRELSMGTALFVLAAGLGVATYGTLAYGAFIGFVGAALLLFSAVRRLRPIPGRRFLVRIVPLAACLGFLFFLVAPMTGSHATFELQSPWRFGYELAAVAIFLALRLVVRWSERPRDSDEIVLLPVALLAVTALDLILVRGYGISWEGWLSVVLCLLLAVSGWVERYRGGLPAFGIPEEIWRVDRISAPGEN
ncbi:MAG TPA: hypothetical protein VGH79_10620 [Gaiellaceae bacterium]